MIYNMLIMKEQAWYNSKFVEITAFPPSASPQEESFGPFYAKQASESKWAAGRINQRGAGPAGGDLGHSADSGYEEPQK